MNSVKEINGLSYDDGINEHRNSDRFLQKDIDQENQQGDGNGRIPVQDAECMGNAQIQNVPRRGSQIRLDGQVDSESVHEQADRRQDHVQDNRTRGTILMKSADFCLLHVGFSHFFRRVCEFRAALFIPSRRTVTGAYDAQNRRLLSRPGDHTTLLRLCPCVEQEKTEGIETSGERMDCNRSAKLNFILDFQFNKGYYEDNIGQQSYFAGECSKLITLKGGRMNEKACL